MASGSVGQYTQGWLPWMGHKAAAQGTWARFNDSSALGMGYLQNSTSAQNDEFVNDIWLDTGTWKIACVYAKSAAFGIMTFSLDGVSQGTIDGYNAATTFNNYTELTGLSVTLASLKTVQVKMATKNGSSSAYYCAIQSIALIRTAGTASIPAGVDTPGYTWHYLPWMGTKSATGFTTRTQLSAFLGGGRLDSASAQNDEFTMDIWLDTGTYKYAQIVHKDTTCGIHSIQLDAVEKGTIDAYAASGSDGNYAEVTGITVSVAASKTFKNKMATKNGSSSGYVGQVSSVAWVRTGA